MNSIISKNIRKIREMKGYSQEYMAHELDINQASYAKLENNSTKLTVDRLFKIADLLETNVSDLLNISTQNIFNQTENDQANAIGRIEHYYQENKETMDKLIKNYEERMEEKNKEIDFLKSLINK